MITDHDFFTLLNNSNEGWGVEKLLGSHVFLINVFQNLRFGFEIALSNYLFVIETSRPDSHIPIRRIIWIVRRLFPYLHHELWACRISNQRCGYLRVIFTRLFKILRLEAFVEHKFSWTCLVAFDRNEWIYYFFDILCILVVWVPLKVRHL